MLAFLLAYLLNVFYLLTFAVMEASFEHAKAAKKQHIHSIKTTTHSLRKWEKHKTLLDAEVRKRHGRRAGFAGASLWERETSKLTQCHFESKRFKTFTIAMRKFLSMTLPISISILQVNSFVDNITIAITLAALFHFLGVRSSSEASDCCLMKHQIRERENNNSKSY